MFTGLIEDKGRIIEVVRRGGGVILGLSTKLEGIEIGDSIAVAGVCLTVVGVGEGGFSVEATEETLKRTTLNGFKVGDRVNLERAAKLGDRLGGHLVQGHVDGVAVVSRIYNKSGSLEIFVRIPHFIKKYVVEKGSVALDGISLTIVRCEGDEFIVSIIPHTLTETTLSELKIGDRVNVECDILGKYVEKMITSPAQDGDSVTFSMLEKHGFVT